MADLTQIPNEMAAITEPTVETTDVTPDDGKTLNERIEDHLKTEADAADQHVRTTFLNDWKRNVDTRLGQPVALYTEGLDISQDLQSTLNPDWSLTKTKTANLFSQVPTIRGTHLNMQYAAAVSPFLKQLNYELGIKRANIAVAMNECLNDVVNASGIAAAIVTYSARFDDVQLPTEDPMLPAPPPEASLMQPGDLPTADPMLPAPDAMAPDMGAAPSPDGPPPVAPPAPAMTPVARPVSSMLNVSRISPRDLLWPEKFVGSDFNCGDWIGHRAHCPKAVAKIDLKMTDEQIRKATEVTESDGKVELRSSQDKVKGMDAESVAYREIFYWRYRQDPNEKSFTAIWRVVYVDGLDKPVIHEAWKGQKYDSQTRKYVGSCKFPIQVLTLTYITDNPVPPSDTQAGRPQVADLRLSRSQMFQNRQRSIPIRWFDVNRIDQDLQGNLMRGIVQGMIPTNGSGERAIGEIARASYPAENIEFDQAAQADLEKSWQIGPNQTGQTTGGTAGEADIVQHNFSTRIGQERGFVAAFLLNLADVASGFLCLYSDFPALTDEERQKMQQTWDMGHVLHDLVLNVVPDSTILLDSDQRIAKLVKALNITAQSGFVNPEPIIAEILELSGIDPAVAMVKPEKKADPPNLSYRFSGKDDMMNPMVLAMYLAQQDGSNLEQKYLDQAKAMLDSLIVPTAPPAAPGMPGAEPPAPEGPPNGQRPAAHPDWEQAPKLATRSREVV